MSIDLLLEGHDFIIEDESLTNDVLVKKAAELASFPEINTFTFEGNNILAQEPMKALFVNLRAFDRLENMNIRNNRLTLPLI